MTQQDRLREISFFRIYRQAVANSAGVMLAYRSNLIFFFLFETFFLTSSFLGAGLGVSLAGGSINGWSRDQVFALTAINGVSHQFFVCFFIAPLFNLPEYIWNGRMDYILQKPLHPLLALIATSEIMISNLPNFLINLGLAVYFILKVAPASGISVWIIFSLIMIIGIGVRFALGIFSMAPAFFAERLVEGEDGFWSVVSTGRFPTSVFPRTVERILLYVIPLFLMAAVPAGFLFKQFEWQQVVMAGISGCFFVIASLLFFNWAVRSYKSVNSGL